jgi:hypothetical protein
VYKALGHQNVDYLQFRMQLIRDVIQFHERPDYRTRGRPMLAPTVNRLTGRHFPEFIPPVGDKPPGSTFRRCILCTKDKQRRESRFRCDVCLVPLCAAPCFKKYHTEKVL